MKKIKKLVLRKTMIRVLTKDALEAAAGGLSGVRQTQSSCDSSACTGEVLGCAGPNFV